MHNLTITVLDNAMNYRADMDRDYYSIDSTRCNEAANKAEYNLEDNVGHLELSYSATVEIVADKINVKCGTYTASIDIPPGDYDGENEDGNTNEEMDELVDQILEVFSLGVAEMSAEDNPEDEDQE